MGKVISMMTRPLKTFNIENRAFKVISKDKPKPAPQYEWTREQLKVAQKINPNFLEEHYKKDMELNENLKSVYITSDDKKQPERKNLPLDRSIVEPFDYGFWQPSKAQIGKVCFKDVLTFMSEYITDHEKHSAKNIAAQYNLKTKDVENILEYFTLMKVIVVDNKAKNPLKGIEKKPETPMDKLADEFTKRF